MLLKLIQIIICCIVACQGWAIDDEGCRTPDRGVGTCMLARNCKMIVAFVKNAPKPMPSHVKSKLNKYVCGQERGAVKVCCPSKPIPLKIAELKMQNKPLKMQNILQKTDSFENHKNIKLLPTDCGYVDISDKISNGNDSVLGEFPWMALLNYRTENGSMDFQCGGTIINNKYILTAAHCLTNLRKGVSLLGVRVGEFDLSTEVDCAKQDDGSKKCTDPVQDLKIEKVIPHPKFTTDIKSVDGFNDIGLIRVADIKPARNIKTICMPLGEARKADLTKVIITGWGLIKENQRKSILQKVSIPIISQSECQKAYGDITISNNQICANGKEKDSCSGDSGGPLQHPRYLNEEIRMVQYGVISAGTRWCGLGSHPGVYTRVESYMNWILDNIEP